MSDDDGDWVDAIHARRKAAAEAAAKQKTEDEEFARDVDAKIGALWDEISAALSKAVERYNSKVSEQRLAVVVNIDPGQPHTFQAQKTVFPAGYFACAPVSIEGRWVIRCLYTFNRSHEASAQREERLQIERRKDNTLGVIRHTMAAEVARTILQPYFEGIG